MKDKQEIKIGSRVLVEDAWEDETGQFHDEIATVTDIIDGNLKLQFNRQDVTDFLSTCEYPVEDYLDAVVEGE